MDAKKVKQKANEVNDISLNYHLTHAVFACNQLLRESYKKKCKSKIDSLNKALKEAYLKKDTEKQNRIMAEIDIVSQEARYYIYVEYLDSPTAKNRVIKTENQLIVSLSKKLLENAFNKDGSFIGDSLKKLRWVTAHELGHALLHSEYMKTNDLEGAIRLDGEAEEEADAFAKELIKLRYKRNEALLKSGAP